MRPQTPYLIQTELDLEQQTPWHTGIGDDFLAVPMPTNLATWTKKNNESSKLQKAIYFRKLVRSNTKAITHPNSIKKQFEMVGPFWGPLKIFSHILNPITHFYILLSTCLQQLHLFSKLNTYVRTILGESKFTPEAQN